MSYNRVLLSWGSSAHLRDGDSPKTLCGRLVYAAVSRDEKTCAETRQCQRCAGLKAQREFKAAEARRVMQATADRVTEETGILHEVAPEGDRIVKVERIVLKIQRRDAPVPLTELFQCPDHGVTEGCCGKIMALGAYRPDERVCCAMCEEPLADERHPDGLKMGATGILGPQCAWCAAHGHPTDSDCDSDCPAEVRRIGRMLFDSIRCPSCKGAPRYPARGCIDAFHDHAPETAPVPAELADWEKDLLAGEPVASVANPHYACDTHGAPPCPTGLHIGHTPQYPYPGCVRCAPVPSPVGWPTAHAVAAAAAHRADGPVRFRAARGKHKRSAHRRGW